MAGYSAQRMIISFLLRSQRSKVIFQVRILERCTCFIHFTSPRRLLCKDAGLLDHSLNISNCNDHYIDHKPILHNIVETLKKILKATNTEIEKILIDNPQLKKRSKANILSNYNSLLEAGIKKNIIVKNVWLLAHENGNLNKKLYCINKLNMNNDHLISWLRLTHGELTNYVLYIQSDVDSYKCNRIEHLAHRLECSVQKMCELIVQYPFLLKIPLLYLNKKLDTLHEYKMQNKYILRDLWIFQYTVNHIRHRCELYRNTNLEIKAWAIRCPFRIILRAIQRNHKKLELMQQYKTINEYLINKMNVDKESFDRVTAKFPNILRINLTKLDELINMLQLNGFNGNEILQCERLLHFSVITIQKRIKILNEVNFRVRLSLLACNETEFKRCVNTHRLEQNVLQNHPNVKCYLINKLNTDEAKLDNMLKKDPKILRVKVLKMDKLIDVLQQSSITTDDILNNGRIFYCSTETLSKRIETLQEAGVPPKASVLTYSQKMFDRHMKHMINRAKKNSTTI